MKLNIGMSAKDIDYVVFFADTTNPNTINWKNFVNKFFFR